jgi:hypothetical protein
MLKKERLRAYIYEASPITEGRAFKQNDKKELRITKFELVWDSIK